MLILISEQRDEREAARATLEFGKVRRGFNGNDLALLLAESLLEYCPTCEVKPLAGTPLQYFKENGTPPACLVLGVRLLKRKSIKQPRVYLRGSLPFEPLALKIHKAGKFFTVRYCNEPCFYCLLEVDTEAMEAACEAHVWHSLAEQLGRTLTPTIK